MHEKLIYMYAKWKFKDWPPSKLLQKYENICYRTEYNAAIVWMLVVAVKESGELQQ